MGGSNPTFAVDGRLLIENVLTHHGVKGMKWGVRKDAGHEGEQAKTKKIDKLDKKFEKAAGSDRQILQVYNKAGKKYGQEDIQRINSKPKYAGQDFMKPSKLRDEYYKEHEDALIKQIEKQVNSLGTNASGTRKYAVTVANDGSWDIYATDVKHDGTPEWHVKVNYDSKGYITGIEMPTDSMAQAEELILNVLAHNGVKGMKWGVRKSGKHDESVHPSSADHLAVQSHRAQAKAGGTRTLSNKQMQEVIQRKQLEQQYFKATHPVLASGTDILTRQAKQQGSRSVSEISTGLSAQAGSAGRAAGAAAKATRAGRGAAPPQRLAITR